MVRITTRKGRKKEYKDYDLSVGAYLKKDYAKLIHKRTGKIKKVKL